MHAFIREAQVYFKKCIAVMQCSYCYPPTDILKHMKLNNDVPFPYQKTLKPDSTIKKKHRKVLF